MKYRVNVDLANQTKAGFSELIDLSTYHVNPVFGVIKQRGSISGEHMLRTFNLGIGIAVVCQQSHVAEVVSHIQGCGEYAYPIGEVVPGHGEVVCTGALRYRE